MSIFRTDLFRGKVALVTGGGTGICRGIAEALAAHGARTVLVSRKAEHLEPTAAEIIARTGQASLALVADVRVPEQVEEAVAQAIERHGEDRLPDQWRGGELPLPGGRPQPQRLRHRDRHRHEGDVERQPGGLPRLDAGPRRPDPQHQRDAPLRRHADAAPRLGGQGGRRRPDAQPRRRVGAGGHPRQRDRPGRHRRHRGAYAGCSPATSPRSMPGPSPSAGWAGSTTSPISRSSCSATPPRTSTGKSSPPTAASPSAASSSVPET